MKVGILQIIRYFLSKLMTKKRLFFPFLFITILTSLYPIILPVFYKTIIDVASNSMLTNDILANELFSILRRIIIMLGLMWITWRVFEVLITKLEIELMADVSKECFEYVHKHSYRFFTNNFAGSLVKQINRLVDSMEAFVDVCIVDILRFLITFIFVIVVVGYQSIYLGLIFGVWISVFLLIAYYLNKWKIPYSIKAVKKDSEVSGRLADTISNNFNISLFGTLKREYKEFAKLMRSWEKTQKASWYRNEAIFAVLGTFTIAIEILLFYLSIRFLLGGSIGIGTFVLLLSYQSSVIGHLDYASHIFKRMYRLFTNASEMVEILNTPHEIKDKVYSKDLDVKTGNIEFKKVNFQYCEGVEVFKDLDLEIKAGEKIALVGFSGSGKSTVVKLLMRFFDLNKGKIVIDGQDIFKVTQQSLRSQISMVAQDPILFHRSLYENIAYGKPDATEQEIVQASKLAHCHDFICKLPNSYDTMVGERGVKLSGGERQRVTIARAILEKSKIFIMDEATSSLDSESEYLIQNAMKVVMKGRTTIVIAHRLSTIMNMDRIIVLEKGAIKEQGSHNELIQRDDGIYRNLWEIQSGKTIN